MLRWPAPARACDCSVRFKQVANLPRRSPPCTPSFLAEQQRKFVGLRITIAGISNGQSPAYCCSPAGAQKFIAETSNRRGSCGTAPGQLRLLGQVNKSAAIAFPARPPRLVFAFLSRVRRARPARSDHANWNLGVAMITLFPYFSRPPIRRSRKEENWQIQ